MDNNERVDDLEFESFIEEDNTEGDEQVVAEESRVKRKYVKYLSESVGLVDWRFFEFCEKRHKKPQKSWDFRKRVRSIVNKVFEVAGNEMLDRRGGVVLDRIGYFCYWVTPRRVCLGYLKKDADTGDTLYVKNFFLNSDGYWYNAHIFTSVFPRNSLHGWLIYDTMSPRLKRRIVEKLNRGHRYVFYRDFLTSAGKKAGGGLTK